MLRHAAKEMQQANCGGHPMMQRRQTRKSASCEIDEPQLGKASASLTVSVSVSVLVLVSVSVSVSQSLSLSTNQIQFINTN